MDKKTTTATGFFLFFFPDFHLTDAHLLSPLFVVAAVSERTDAATLKRLELLEANISSEVLISAQNDQTAPFARTVVALETIRRERVYKARCSNLSAYASNMGSTVRYLHRLCSAGAVVEVRHVAHFTLCAFSNCIMHQSLTRL